jgi:hypothetical protein
MKKSKRILLLFCFIEAIILGGGFLLLHLTKDLPPSAGNAPGETASRIFEVMGMAGGGIGAMLLALFFVVRSKEGNTNQ